ncbi:aminotransferase class I/II-fold pyridoxal phosphate-dependent enzyme [Cellulomonas sp. S1-8]|uniref:aminotransferase class I/II-fold pyridoxal phosphate-dependent enzyme n=1 Tax=Cellulomonas sp. S1-8 TaxID=2904790 RepID=UPI00224430C3|nr:aminotransferase class I/II-fold pyridoxal phosphate-dependent enzyme [Cellulomonas sp. S1-8]UZN02965.1 DegT/DnrJ/EryC1/StrS family aminotransferase [Cellulomonas sp. S1-8]
MRSNELALVGGEPAVTTPHPHEPWPPAPLPGELERLARQRTDDIGIRGNAGPIGELEREFRDHLTPGRTHSIAYNSGTSAMLAAMMAVGVGPGDEVIAPVLTYHAAVSPARALGAGVRFADVELGSRCLDPAAVRAAITPRTRAVVVVHQWGRAAALREILAVAAEHGLAVIEDCSHAHGSRYDGRPVGTWGDVAIFSLQANKAVYAGEGGILVTDDDGIADRAILAGHYRDRARADVRDAGLRAFWESGYGLKLRMSPFNAIVALESLRRFDDLARQRQDALGHLNDALVASSTVVPVEVPDRRDMGAWYGYKPYLSDAGVAVGRDRVVEALRAEGVEVDAPSGRLLARLPLFAADDAPWRAAAGDEPSPMPDEEVAERFPRGCFLEANALSLPTFYRWPDDRGVVEQYLDAFAKVDAHLDRLAAVPAGAAAGARPPAPRDAASHGR